ncbi:MAG: pyrroloquinoline quinone biosynthesis peptide chaperone PqqD [Rhodovibrio sp.]|nr:pyrroloquinoline quinone biosynthesis peptide chaperone PqqD [Rhodovibrio sp.]
MSVALTADSVPRLAPGVRLKDDKARGQTVLLAPERVLVPDATAVEVLQRLDGRQSVAQLSKTLAAEYDAPVETIQADVVDMLADLAEKGFVEA